MLPRPRNRTATRPGPLRHDIYSLRMLLTVVLMLCLSPAVRAQEPDTLSYATERRVPEALKARPGHDSPPRLITVKTNLVPWCASVMNIGVEMQLSGNISLSLPVWYCPWFISDRRALRVAALQPEGRWWFHRPGEGHFAGVHASVAWYNLKWGRYRYQDNSRPLLGAGLTYGYAFRFDPHWGLELSAGVGFVNTRYDRFYNTRNGQLADTRATSYFGPDHLSISILYHINP